MASQGMHSPVEQFEIKPLIELSAAGFDISFTNSSLFMLLAILVSGIFLVTAMRRGELVPGRMQGAAEMMYEFVADMVRSNVGSEGRAYFPIHLHAFCLPAVWQHAWVDPLFLYFHIADRCHLFYGSLCLCRCHLDRAVQARPALLQLLRASRGAKGADPFLIVIEVISYFVRPVSLSVRLFANMLAGHTMLKVFAGLAVMISGAGGLAYGRFAAAISGTDWPHRAGGAGGGTSGLCFHDFDLHVFERCSAPALGSELSRVIR